MNTGLFTLLLATTLFAPSPSLGSAQAVEPRSPVPPLVNTRLESRARQVEQYFELALTYTQQGNLEGAIASYQKVLKLEPDHGDAHYNLGLLQYAQGNISQGMIHFQQAIQLTPQVSDAYVWLGKGYYSQEQVPTAMQLWEKAIEIDPRSVYAYNSLGDAWTAQGNYTKAIAYYRQGLTHPDQEGIPVSAHTLAHNGLGYALQQQGNLKEAITEYQAALRLDPSFSPAQANLQQAQQQLQ